MLHWTPANRASRKLPPELKRTIKTIRRALEDHEREGHPRLERVTYRDRSRSHVEFEATVEVAPGLLLPVEWDGELAEVTFEQARGDIVAEVLDGVAACLEHALPLSEMIERVRGVARRQVAALQREGLPTRLLRVALTPYDHWRGSLLPGFDVDVETLDNRLQPVAASLRIANAEGLAAEMDDVAHALRRRSAARARLMAEGIDGTIDELALVASRALVGEVDVLRQLGSNERLWLPDGTCLLWSDGHVSSSDGLDRGDGYSWNDDHFSSSELLVDAEAGRAAIGQPATRLMHHPYLTDDMIVRKVESGLQDGEPLTTMTLDMPRRRFCATTGRVW